MNTTKIINYAVAIFALIILALAIAPKLSADEIKIGHAESKIININNKPITVYGLYFEIVDLSGKDVTGEVLESNKQYKINYVFRTSENINFTNPQSKFEITAIYESQPYKLYTLVYGKYLLNSGDTIFKVAKTNDGFIYVQSYILDKSVFEEIEMQITNQPYKTKEFSIMKNIRINISENDYIFFSNFAHPITINFSNTNQYPQIQTPVTQNLITSENTVISEIITDSTNLTTKPKVTYNLEIPCAIDRTQIIVPNPINPEYSGQYKMKCNSSAYFNNETKTHHLKKNEGYYLNLNLTNEGIEKQINLSEINNVTLNFYSENQETICFTRNLNVVASDNSKFVAKIGYVKPNDSEEFGLENMTGFINSCGINTNITFKAMITLNTGETIMGYNAGNLNYLIVDSDNSNIVAENARKKQELNSKPDNEKPQKEQLTVRSEKKIDSQELFITKEKSIQKIIPIYQILEENNLNTDKIVGEIILETESDIPAYVFEIKEQKKLFGFIPFGEKTIEKRISAIREIKE